VQGPADHLIRHCRPNRSALLGTVSLVGIGVLQGVLLLGMLGGMSSCDGGGAALDAGAPDAPGDAPGTRDGSPDEAAAVRSCLGDPDCLASQFCGIASQACVSDVVQVVAGQQHSCSRHADGTVRCWGLAESIRAAGAVVLPPGEIAQAAGALDLSAGVHQTCAVTRDRGVRCWGNRELEIRRAGAAGDPLPLQDVTAVSLSASYGCAINPQGAWCWGSNEYGQLGQPLATPGSDLALRAHAGGQRFVATGIAAVVQDLTGRLCAWGRNATKMVTASDEVGLYTTPQCRTVEGAVAQLVAGDTHACVLHAGSFTCWGERYYGALGIGGTDTADVGPPGTPTTLSQPVTAMSAGVSHTCVLTADHAVICFGRNHLGQIGPLAMSMVEEEVRQPTSVPGFSGEVVQLGGGSTAHHTCAILASGGVQCWGADATGQLGDGVKTIVETRKTPVPVTVQF
jgi:alpha-tubulin suppressor-like RCC1 family protein